MPLQTSKELSDVNKSAFAVSSSIKIRSWSEQRIRDPEQFHAHNSR